MRNRGGRKERRKKGEEGEGYLSLALFSRIRSMLREGAG